MRLDNNQFYDPDAGPDVQEYYCKRNNKPYFAPPSGFCPSCGMNIYAPGGVPFASAGAIHVTGCPFCHRSFCD